jgi:putative Ca2+/H+ antiporter (TMEM165/GDT1 family)
MTGLSAVMGVVLPAIMSRKYTHFLASLLFFYFGLKLLYDSREMVPGVVSDELAEVEEELNSGKKDDSESKDEVSVGHYKLPLALC